MRRQSMTKTFIMYLSHVTGAITCVHDAQRPPSSVNSDVSKFCSESLSKICAGFSESLLLEMQQVSKSHVLAQMQYLDNTRFMRSYL